MEEAKGKMIKVNCPCCGNEREITEEDYFYGADGEPCLDCYYEGDGEI